MMNEEQINIKQEEDPLSMPEIKTETIYIKSEIEMGEEEYEHVDIKHETGPDAPFVDCINTISELYFRNPGKRLRTTDKCKWTTEELKAAINAVRDGRKLREVARQFKIPVTTLFDRLKSGKTDNSIMGRKCVFSSDEENEIANHLITLSKEFYSLTPIEFRRIAYQYADRKRIKHPFNHETKLAGKDWLHNFMDRHPELSFRKSETTFVNRTPFNKNEINRFYENLISVFAKNCYPPIRIFNVDETKLTTVHKYDRKSAKQIDTATSSERGEYVTLCCCMNAAGMYVPPMFIFPRPRMEPTLEINGPPGSIYSCSKNGWMTEELFLVWLTHFCNSIHPTPDNPVLLILDNHSSHISLVVYEFCRERNITLLSVPSHSNHRLQPLHLTFFGPLKTAYNQECQLYMKSHPSQKILIADIPYLVAKAYDKVATLEKTINGFDSAGICPLNTEKFKNYEFDTSEATREHNDADDGTRPHSEISIGETPGTSGIRLSADDSIDITPVSRKSHCSQENTPKQHFEILTSSPMKEKANLMARRKKEEKTKQQKKKRKLFDDTSSSDGSVDDMESLCNDNLPCETEDICCVCDEFGKDNEIWFRCVRCSVWAHKDCTGWDKPTGYICDFCSKI